MLTDISRAQVYAATSQKHGLGTEDRERTSPYARSQRRFSKGLDYEAASFSLLLLAVLIARRRDFTVKSSVPDLQDAFMKNPREMIPPGQESFEMGTIVLL